MRPIIARRTSVRDYQGLINLGNAVYEGISGNFYFASPSLPMSVLRAIIDEVEELKTKWGTPGNRGSKADLTRLRTKSRYLWSMLSALALYVESTAKITAPNNYPL